MTSAQEILDEINLEKIDYDLDLDSFIEEGNVWEEVEAELHKSIYQELTIPIEARNIYWAQTLIDTV